MSARYQDGYNAPLSPTVANDGYPHGQQQQGMGGQQPVGHSYPPLNSPPSFTSTAPSGEYQSVPHAGDNGYGQQGRYSQPNGANNGPRMPPGAGNGRAPVGSRQDSTYSVGSEYSKNPSNGSGGHASGPHPLSNALYVDSSPTLHESTTSSEEYRKGESEKSRLAGGYANGGPRDSGFRRFSGAFVAGKRASDDYTTIKRNRVGYLDGLKFLAACIVLNATFFDAVVEDDGLSILNSNSALYFVRSRSLGVAAFLVLLGRSILDPLWEVPTSSAALNKDKPSSSASGPSVAWFKLSRALLTRPFRFLLPILVIAALQWGLRATNRTANCNAVGMNEPYWNEIRSFAGYATLTFNLYTQYNIEPVSGLTFGANLFATPWFFQSSYCAYVIHIMLGNLSSNRYWVYGALAFFSWTSFTFFYATILGVVICDMAVHGQFAKIQKWPFLLRLALQLSIAALGIAVEVVPVIRNNLNSGMATISVHGLAEWINFSSCLCAALLLVVVETSTWTQFIFGNVVMRLLGKLAAGIFLLAPAITYTIIPDLALSMSNSGSGSSAILGVSWVVLFLTCFGLAILFHFLVELPSKIAGEYFAEFCMNWGRTDDTRAAIKAANAQAKAGIKAPVSAPARLKKQGS